MVEKCECGNELNLTRIYRITPFGETARYLREYFCQNHGHMVFNDRGDFVRMGKLDKNGDDSNLTGGYWI
jgi:hypothetical protein